MGDSPAAAQLKQWLRENNCLSYPQDESGSPPTVLDMGGGKYWITDSKYDAFLNRYADLVKNQVAQSREGLCVKSNPAISLTECRGEVFRYFVDFDIVAPRPLEDARLAQLAEILTAVVVRFFLSGAEGQADRRTTLVLSCAPPLRKSEGSWKVGVHANFPEFFVTKDMALQMRELLVAEFMREFGPVLGGPSAELVRDIIDASVYRQPVSGLRMLGSAKVVRCETCRGNPEQKKECLDCREHLVQNVRQHGKNWHAERNYTVHSVYRDGVIDPVMTSECNANFAKGVRLTSIRTPSGAVACADWAAPKGCPPILPPPTTKSGKAVAGESYEMKTDQEATKKLFKKREVLLPTDERVDCMLQSVRGLHSKWLAVDAREAFYLPDSGLYIFKGHGCGSYWCKNKRDYHQSSGVYWVFEPTGGGTVHQRCFCVKESIPQQTNPDASQRCSVYRSRREQLHSKVGEKLWPNLAKATRRDSQIKRHRNA